VSYHIASADFESEYVVKKSRFIARVVPVNSREDALAAVALAKSDYPDARHHCWAYLLGSPKDARSAGMSDDGEPAGTAGKPILNVMQHGQIGDVLVVVTRYFGGVKLGAGGLVRAYGTATQRALDLTPSEPKLELQIHRVQGGFEKEQLLRHWLGTVHGKMDTVEYAEHNTYTIVLPAGMENTLVEFCAAQQLQLEEAGSTQLSQAMLHEINTTGD